MYTFICVLKDHFDSPSCQFRDLFFFSVYNTETNLNILRHGKIIRKNSPYRKASMKLPGITQRSRDIRTLLTGCEFVIDTMCFVIQK